MSCPNEIRMLRALRDATLEEVELARKDGGEPEALRIIALARIFDTAATTLACQDKALIDAVCSPVRVELSGVTVSGDGEILGPLGGGGE